MRRLTATVTPPVHIGQLLIDWQIRDTYACAAFVAQLAALAAYLAGVVRVRRRGRRWPPRRIAAFALGMLALNVALVSGLASYDDDVFAVHIVQHVLLMMVGPPLLSLGAPITLALQAISRSSRARLVRCLHHQAVRVLGTLAVSSLLYYSTMYLYFVTPFYGYSLNHELAHNISHLVMFAVGCLLWWPMVGPDPVPGRPSPRARISAMLIGMPIEALLALLIVRRGPTVANWYSPGDVRTGAAVFAAAAALSGVVAIVAVHIRSRTSSPAGAARGRWPRRSGAGRSRSPA
jgi:putative membrane protein